MRVPQIRLVDKKLHTGSNARVISSIRRVTVTVCSILIMSETPYKISQRLVRIKFTFENRKQCSQLQEYALLKRAL